jgi:ubiquinol-cytochrome c reductase subunit 6
MVEETIVETTTEEVTFEEKPEIKEAPVDVADDDDEEEEEEEELVDPIDALRESCSKDAESQALLSVLSECTERVEGRSMTEETCQQVNCRFFFEI